MKHLKTIVCLSLLWLLASTTARASVCDVQRVDDAKELVEIIQNDWSEDHFEKIVVTEGSGQVEVDGEKENFTEVFATSSGSMKRALSSRENLEEFLEEQQEETGAIYDMEELKDGSYVITAPYQTKRIVVRSTNISGTYGAKSKYIYDEGSETIFCYETEEETKAAYQKMITSFGEKNCFLDEIVSMNYLKQSVSWGGDNTGMDSLKTHPQILACQNTVTVAVVDTGITTRSSIFNGRTISPASFNFVFGTNNVSDTIGHGTHVAGIVADMTPKNVQLLVLKIADNNGSSSTLTINLAMNYAVSQNADVINCSYGFMSKNASGYTFLDDAIERAYNQGIPICAAAGNETNGIPANLVEYCYPACNDQTITVSALDRDNSFAPYSFYGPKVDFAAPGTNIESAGLRSYSGYTAKMSGTSMAAPHIAAAFAYIKLMNKRISVQGASLELQKHCVDLGAPGKDPYYGYGIPVLSRLLDVGMTYGNWTIDKSLGIPTVTDCYNDGSGSVLTWNGVLGAEGYYVYRRKNNGANVRVGYTPANICYYRDHDVNEGDLCIYYVVAVCPKDGSLMMSGNSTKVANVVLKQLPVLSVKGSKGKKVVIKKKSQDFWSGKVLEVQFSKNRFFSGVDSKWCSAHGTKNRVKAKKKGSYYVRIRSSFNYNGKTYTSPWTPVRKIKVK